MHIYPRDQEMRLKAVEPSDAGSARVWGDSLLAASKAQFADRAVGGGPCLYFGSVGKKFCCTVGRRRSLTLAP